MLRRDQGRDGSNLGLAQMLTRAHERFQGHPALGLAVPRHRVSEPQRCPLAIRKQRAAFVVLERTQRIDRQLCLAPEMPAAFDAPAAATALSGELGDEHAESRIEIGVVAVVASERGIRGQHSDAAGRDRRCIAGGNECPPKPSHKCTHDVIQLYHRC
jgi:hypothetical protein